MKYTLVFQRKTHATSESVTYIKITFLYLLCLRSAYISQLKKEFNSISQNIGGL